MNVPETRSGKIRTLLTGNSLVLLILSLAYLVSWTFIVPMFESPDEQSHWQVAQYIHNNIRLPFYGPNIVEGNQGPVYYFLISPFAINSELPKVDITVQNHQIVFQCFPRIWQICPSDLHRFWPMRLARLCSAILGLFGVLAVYLSLLEVTGSRSPAFLGGALFAFLPGFAFRVGNISNDGLMTVISAIATYWLILLLYRGFTWKRASLASLFVGLAFLTKVNAVILFAGFAFVLISIEGTWPQRVKRLAALAPGLALVAPWLIRNKLLYGDLFASKAMLTAVPGLIAQKTLDSPYFGRDFFILLFKTAVGTFGGVLNIYLPDNLYLAYLAFFLIGLAAVLFLAISGKIDRRLVSLLIALCVLALASVIQLNLTISQPQGRYLYAALPAFTILVALGWRAVLVNRGVPMLIVACISITTGAFALLGIEKPAYSKAAQQGNEKLQASVVVLPGDATVAGPLPASYQFGQTFTVSENGLNKVEAVVATWNRTIEKGRLTLHLRTSPSAKEDIATAAITPEKILNNLFVTLQFKPILDSAGKSYYFYMDQQGIPPETPVTVYISRHDVYSGGSFYRDRQPENGDMVFRVFSSSVDNYCMSCP